MFAWLYLLVNHSHCLLINDRLLFIGVSPVPRDLLIFIYFINAMFLFALLNIRKIVMQKVDPVVAIEYSSLIRHVYRPSTLPQKTIYQCSYQSLCPCYFLARPGWRLIEKLPFP